MKHFLKKSLAFVLALALTTSSICATDYVAWTAEELYETFLQCVNQQETDFSISYEEEGDELNISKPTLGAFQQISMAHFDYDYGADLVSLNLRGGDVDLSGNDFYFTDMEYIDTSEEEATVQEKVAEIVESLDIEEADDFVKIKTIYEYMTSHFVYDKTLSIFSAYDGLEGGSMVCQGYAILTKRLMDEAGIPCRIITGYSESLLHAWNIVEYQGEWYLLDTTWDSTDEIGASGDWVFFMKSLADFEGHDSFAVFETDSFLERHPMTETSYDLEYIVATVAGSTVESLAIRLGITVELGAILPDDARADDLVWTVGDSEILELVDGTLTAKAQGTTWISVESPENPQWVTGFVPVTTVDLTTLSDWASETVTEYYLAQMLPISLCSDFQDGITRSELAVLVDELAKNTKGYESFTVDNPFADMSHLDVSTQYAILRCYVAGLMIGTDVDTFSPDDLVTREQAAVVLMRALANIQETHYDIQGEASFTDNDDISDWAVETVTIAQEQGVMVGDTAGNFNPQTTMTREEMIVACSSIYAQYNP